MSQFFSENIKNLKQNDVIKSLLKLHAAGSRLQMESLLNQIEFSVLMQCKYEFPNII